MLLGALVVLLGAAPAARAEPPGRLDGQVTDLAGVLDDDAALARLGQLQADTGVQLWVAFTRTFDGRSGDEWAAQTHELSGFGEQDVLLSVAVEERSYG